MKGEKGEWVKVWWWRTERDCLDGLIHIASERPRKISADLKVCEWHFCRIFGVDVPYDPFEPREIWLRGEASFERPDDDDV